MIKKMSWGIALFALVILLQACGNTGEAKNRLYDNFKGKLIIVDQDTFDSDNLALITAALNADKKNIAKVLAFAVSGKDFFGRGGLIFSSLLGDTDVPILINQSNPETRVTPSTQYYDFTLFSNDGLMDNQREDSTQGLYKILMDSPRKVTYVVGGHLGNLVSLLEEYPDVVKNKIDTISIVVGWKSRTDGKPETNLSQGIAKRNGVGDMSIKFFKLLPKSVKVVVTIDPSAPRKPIALSEIESDTLKYFIKNGRYYKDGQFQLGDAQGLIYGLVGTEWYGDRLSNEIKTCFKTNEYGAIKISGGDCNHYYLDNENTQLIREVYKFLLKG